MTELLNELRAALEATQQDPAFKHLAPQTRIQVNAALERLYAHRTVARVIPNEDIPTPTHNYYHEHPEYAPSYERPTPGPYAGIAAETDIHRNYRPTPSDIDEFIAQIREYYK